MSRPRRAVVVAAAAAAAAPRDYSGLPLASDDEVECDPPGDDDSADEWVPDAEDHAQVARDAAAAVDAAAAASSDDEADPYEDSDPDDANFLLNEEWLARSSALDDLRDAEICKLVALAEDMNASVDAGLPDTKTGMRRAIAALRRFLTATTDDAFMRAVGVSFRMGVYFMPPPPDGPPLPKPGGGYAFGRDPFGGQVVLTQSGAVALRLTQDGEVSVIYTSASASSTAEVVGAYAGVGWAPVASTLPELPDGRGADLLVRCGTRKFHDHHQRWRATVLAFLVQNTRRAGDPAPIFRAMDTPNAQLAVMAGVALDLITGDETLLGHIERVWTATRRKTRVRHSYRLYRPFDVRVPTSRLGTGHPAPESTVQLLLAVCVDGKLQVFKWNCAHPHEDTVKSLLSELARDPEFRDRLSRTLKVPVPDGQWLIDRAVTADYLWYPELMEHARPFPVHLPIEDVGQLHQHNDGMSDHRKVYVVLPHRKATAPAIRVRMGASVTGDGRTPGFADLADFADLDLTAQYTVSCMGRTEPFTIDTTRGLVDDGWRAFFDTTMHRPIYPWVQFNVPCSECTAMDRWTPAGTCAECARVVELEAALAKDQAAWEAAREAYRALPFTADDRDEAASRRDRLLGQRRRTKNALDRALAAQAERRSPRKRKGDDAAAAVAKKAK